jgi:hypothetical protein
MEPHRAQEQDQTIEGMRRISYLDPLRNIGSRFFGVVSWGGYVHANLGDDGGGSGCFDGWDGLQQRDRFLIALQVLINFRLNLGDGFLQIIDVREHLSEQKSVMSLSPSFQSTP